MFAKTAIKRIGRDRFIRNVLIAIGNCGDPALRRRPSGCWPTRRRWCAARRCGRSGRLDPARLAALRRAMR